jgi:hypothetical protein
MVWYATREVVMAAADVKLSAYMASRVDEALESASRLTEGLTNRPTNYFVPTIATRYFDWPNHQYARTWRLWLDQDEVISVSSLVSGGVTISASDYFLEPVNDGPPYDRVEVDLDSVSSFSSAGTHQRQIAVTGTFGYRDTSTVTGALAEALDSSETGVDVTDSSGIGTGSLIKVDTERMLVTGRTMADTAVDIHASDSLAANAADTSILCSTAAAIPQPGETILIDSERMLVVDLASTTITVRRAHDGTVLATHAASASIFAPRTLTVVRASAGTTAAAHDTAAAITTATYPGPVVQLTKAYALDQLQQEGSAYARTVGSGESERQASGRAIKELERRVMDLYARRFRMAAI